MKYNKLVRDKIPGIIKKKGETSIFHTANKKEYWEGLKQKLKEEVEEFLRKPNEEELADILEVIYAICEFKKIKKKERGGFEKKIILEEII